MKYKPRFEEALATESPTEALRVFALELAASGLRRREIYKIFLDYDYWLQEEERNYESALVGDVMDMISQTYPPFNLNIPDDEK